MSPCLNQQKTREKEGKRREEMLSRRRIWDRARCAAQTVEQRQVVLQVRWERPESESIEVRGTGWLLRQLKRERPGYIIWAFSSVKGWLLRPVLKEMFDFNLPVKRKEKVMLGESNHHNFTISFRLSSPWWRQVPCEEQPQRRRQVPCEEYLSRSN